MNKVILGNHGSDSHAINPEMSLRFLIPPEFMAYDLSRPPGRVNRGGGMGVKYARVEKAGGDDFDCKRISTVDEVEANDIVFCDWLWFCAGGIGTTMQSQAKQFVELSNPKIIYGSELAVLGYPRTIIRRLVESADLITYNTQYQRDLYKVIDIHNARFLCDPIPESLFKPASQKERRIVCVGQISQAKRSEAVVEIFEHLSGSDVQRVYVGGNIVWGESHQDKKSSELHFRIAELADTFVENATELEMAQIVNRCAFYGHVSKHDVASSGMQENGLAGNVIFGLTHPVLKERTSYRFRDPKSLAEAVSAYPFESEQHQQDIDAMLAVAKDWSYAAWRQQLAYILRIIL